MREDTTPPPADGGVGMKVPQAGGGRINQPRPPPVCRPPPPTPLLPLPHGDRPSPRWFPLCSEIPRQTSVRHRAPGGAGSAGGGRCRPRAAPPADPARRGGRARSSGPRPPGDPHGAGERRAAPPPSAPRTATSAAAPCPPGPPGPARPAGAAVSAGRAVPLPPAPGGSEPRGSWRRPLRRGGGTGRGAGAGGRFLTWL